MINKAKEPDDKYWSLVSSIELPNAEDQQQGSPDTPPPDHHLQVPPQETLPTLPGNFSPHRHSSNSEQGPEKEKQVRVNHPESQTESFTFLQPSVVYGQNMSSSPIHTKDSHPTNLPETCTICDSTVYNLEAMENHVDATHINSSLGCEYCKLVFTSRTDLSSHIVHSHNQTSPKCYLCDLSFLTYDDLKTHTQTHNGVVGLHCTQCNLFFPSLEQLYVHIQVTNLQIE